MATKRDKQQQTVPDARQRVARPAPEEQPQEQSARPMPQAQGMRPMPQGMPGQGMPQQTPQGQQPSQAQQPRQMPGQIPGQLQGQPVPPQQQPQQPQRPPVDPTMIMAMEAAVMTTVGEEQVRQATETLTRYRSGKQNLEARVVQDEQFWKLRHWEEVESRKAAEDRILRPRPTSAWLVSDVIAKHADAMDNYPEPVVLPREESDEQSAEVLTEILPVLLKKNKFRKVYSDCWYEKLKHGTAVYGIMWDKSKENGLGDVTIKRIDLLNIFWEPGCEDIQESENLFITQLVDNDKLEKAFPDLKNKVLGKTVQTAEYKWDESIDISQKTVVVDWYYKKTVGGRQVVHYVQFAGSEVLYASENDIKYHNSGYYNHGKYPVVFDVLYPEKGTPCGFGVISMGRDPQLYIDQLDANILESSLINTRKRYFVSDSLNINLDQAKDENEMFIEVAGQIDDTRLQEWTQSPLTSIYADIRQAKIEELKETTANRDVSNGGSSSVTAAAGIAALQEAGNKCSRDMISQSYEAHTEIIELVIELMRQFYDESRAFRIILPNGQSDFIRFSNAALKEQPTIKTPSGEQLYRLPVFDLEITSQKKNPFSRVEENERAISLYQLGFFNAERADEALMALDMMDFEGIEKIKDKIAQNQQLVQQIQQLMQVMQQQSAVIAQLTGQMPEGQAQGQPAQGQAQQTQSKQRQPQQQGQQVSTPVSDHIMQAQTPMTDYGQRLAKAATPSVGG